MTHTPSFCRPAAFLEFEQAVGDIESTAGLVRGATAIARHEMPEASLPEVEATLQRLADLVLARVSSSQPQALLAHLHDVLFEVVEFAGNEQDYYDVSNSYLPAVLKRRCGIPITLVLVYKAVAEHVGLDVQGINAPGHFLAVVNSPDLPGGRIIVDPFFGGVLLTPEEALARISLASGRPVDSTSGALGVASHAVWLGRMLNNLQVVFAHSGRERDVWAMEELQHLLTCEVQS